MTRGVKFRRGSTADHSNYTGLEGEITVNTDKDCLVVHDGATLGGFEQVSVASTQTLTNKTLASPSITSPTISGTASASTLGVTGLSTTRNLNVIGVTTSAFTQSTNLNVTGVTTTTTLGVTGFSTARNLTVVGVATATTFSGNVSSTNIQTTNLNATGVTTAATLRVTGLSTVTNSYVVGVTTSASFRPTAGTTSVAPILLTAGTNLSAPTSGAIEYDGHVFYATPKSNRGVIFAPEYYVLNSNRTGPATANTPINLLPVTSTLKAGIRYLIEFYWTLQKPATVAAIMNFATTSSSGTIDRTFYRTIGAVTANNRFAVANGQVASNELAGHVSNIAITSSNSNAAFYDVQGRLWVDVNTGGDVSGYSIQVSTTANTATTILAGANVSIYPIGPVGSDTSVGSWV